MKGEIINCPAHKDIYFLETNTKSENTNLANLFASPAGREMFKYKPRPKLKHKLNPALELLRRFARQMALRFLNFLKLSQARVEHSVGAIKRVKLANVIYNPGPATHHKTEWFFIQNKSANSSLQDTTHKATTTVDNKCSTSASSPTSEGYRSRRSSIDLYEEAASILGLTCSQTDDCKCIECQCHYFDFEEDMDYPGECVVDHSSSCTIQ